MSDLQISQLIELPHMGVDKCVQITVPKVVGETWTAGGIEDSSTTRLKKNANGQFYVVSTDDSQGSIACAATAAASSAESGSIWLYPNFRLPTFRKQIIDEPLLPVGGFRGLNLYNSMQCRRLPKKPEDTFATGDMLNWDYDKKRLIKSGGYAVETAKLPSESGSRYGYPWHRYSYSETNYNNFTNGMPDKVVLEEYPVISGGADLEAGPISVDISGNYFSGADPSSLTHGFFNDDYCIPISGNYGFNNDGSTKFNSNLDLLASATNVEYVNVYPSFRKDPQYIYPVPAKGQTHAVGTDEHGATIFQSRSYEWAYRLRRYYFQMENGLAPNPSWRPCITLDIPAITWTREDPDEEYWSPPSAPSYSDNHTFVLNTLSFSLVRNEPPTAAMSKFYRSPLSENSPRQGNAINNSKYDVVEDQDGDLVILGESNNDIVWDQPYPYSIDTATKWHAGVVGMETITGAANDLQIKIFDTHPDTGVVTVKLDWTTMSKSVVGKGPYVPATPPPFPQPAKDYTSYDMYNWYKEISLGDLGYTIVDLDNITVQTKLSTSPSYHSSSLWGKQIGSGGTFFPRIDNYFIHNYSEGTDPATPDAFIPCNKRDIYNVSVVTNNGDKISNDRFVKGYLPKYYKPTCEIPGTMTYSTTYDTSGGDRVFYIEGVAEYTPEFASFGDEIQIITPALYPSNYMWQKVTRKRDGATVNGLVYTTPSALIWSHKNIHRWNEVPLYPSGSGGTVTYGTLGTPIRSFPVRFKIPKVWVDIAPDRTFEEFIVETKFLARYQWVNHPATFKAITDKQTITVTKP